MKAIVSTKYGSPEVLKVSEVEKPKPKANEVLIKVHAASVTRADAMMRTGTPYIGRLFIGLTKPKQPVPGTGFAGVVESVGKDVSLYKKGDKVFGESIFSYGTNAEYTCVPELGIMVLKPENLSFEEAASICDGALTSLNFLKEVAQIKPGQKVLINGASGSLGTAAIQLAKSFGAEVTGVCSTTNLELVKSLGANKVIDYTKENFVNSNEKYDIIFETIGNLNYSLCKHALTENGKFISPVLKPGLLGDMICTSLFGKKKALFSATGTLPTNKLLTLLQELVEIIEEGKLISVVDRSYRMEEIVAAHSYVDKGHKKGNVVLAIA